MASAFCLRASKRAGDPWQIWELTLADRSRAQVDRRQTEDAIRPFYLPGGRLVYAQRTPHGFQLRPLAGTTRTGSAIDPTQAGGASAHLPAGQRASPPMCSQTGAFCLKPASRSAPDRLRSCFWSTPTARAWSRTAAITAQPRWGGKQLASGDVVFTHGASLARFTSPLAHEERVAAPHAEYAGAIAETASGAWLVSARAAAGTAVTHSSCGSPERAGACKRVLAESGENLVEPVLVAPRARGPSAIPPGCTTGATPTCWRWMRAIRATAI